MERQFPGRRHAWSIASIVLAACAASPEGDGFAPCASRAPLFFASANPGALSLAPAQRAAMGAIQSDVDGPVLCTATLIAPGLAVTAAHCADVGGAAFRLSSRRTLLPIKWRPAHPELDVALFEVEDGVDGYEPIPLFQGSISEAWVGSALTLAGLGQTETGSTGELRFVEEEVVAVTGTEIWVDGMGRSGACGGDSGGPLLVQDETGAVAVAGTLDRGSADCTGLDVYVRADRIAGWIEAPGAEADERCPR